MISPLPLAQALIRCPSVTPHDEGVMEVMRKELERLGFRVMRQRFDEVENLYARIGSEGPNFCFAGHLDVVPVGDLSAWDYDPFGAEVHGGVLYGRGAEDMKGAIACFTAAVERYLTAHPLKGSISLLLTLDEEGPAENGTVKMLEWLKEHGEILDICLVGEPTNPHRLGEMIKIGRRGSLNCALIVSGRQGHVAYPELAENPIYRLMRILTRLKSEPLDEGTKFFPPSNLEVTSIDVGNPATNVIPAKAAAKFNLRFNDSQTAKNLKMWIQEICEEEDGEFELEMRVSGEAFHTNPGRLTDILQDVAEEVTGLRPELSTTGGTSDARFIKNFCPVVEFGTTGRTAHHVNENVEVAVLEQLTKIYEKMLERFFSSLRRPALPSTPRPLAPSVPG